ncbi:MAG: GntP family permease [Bacteroidia bacterium]
MLAVFLLLVAVALIVLLSARFQVHPFLALLAGALLFGLGSGLPLDALVKAVNDGFGETLGKIGLVIVLGVIMGTFLEQSGGAFRLAEAILRLTGRQRIHEAMAAIGYLVSIPVFVDSGFVILQPLNRSLSKRAGVSLAGTSVALILGLLMTHVMVPPTPGPVAAAGILQANVGLVILAGLAASAAGAWAAVVFARRYASRTWIDPAPDLDDAAIEARMRQAPGTLVSFLPIVVPIVLIVAAALLGLQPSSPSLGWAHVVQFLGSPVIALLIGMLLSFTLPRHFDRAMLSASGWVGKSIGDAATILLVTGAGGIFGKVLQVSGIADTLAGGLQAASLGIWLPFVLAAAIKCAQGSSTVAIITTASILAPMAVALGFTTEIDKALLVVAIGAGSAVVPHVNDSSFWVLTQLSQMDIRTGYRLYSLGALVAGTTAALLVALWSWLV